MYHIDPTSPKAQLVGSICQEVIDSLRLPYKPCNIYIGPSNIRHIASKHPDEYDKYLQHIPLIIQCPDYIGVHPKQGGIEFVKRFDVGIMVSVRLSSSGIPFVRSLYAVAEEKIERYLKRGTLIIFRKAAAEEKVAE